jgi:hypothetical protein
VRPQPPKSPRIWTRIRRRYWPAKIDDISLITQTDREVRDAAECVCRAISSLELSKSMLVIALILLLNILSKTFFISGKGPLLYYTCYCSTRKKIHLRTLLLSFYFPTPRRRAGELGDGSSILLQLLQDYRGGGGGGVSTI